MKTEDEIRRQLEDIYCYRLSLRVGRMTRRACRNCSRGVQREFDLGEFGSMSRWECMDGETVGEKCHFKCQKSQDEIEDEMMRDISDPSVCGAKEPKIAALLWVLHDGGRGCRGDGGDDAEDGGKPGVMSFIRGLFK